MYCVYLIIFVYNIHITSHNISRQASDVCQPKLTKVASKIPSFTKDVFTFKKNTGAPCDLTFCFLPPMIQGEAC